MVYHILHSYATNSTDLIFLNSNLSIFMVFSEWRVLFTFLGINEDSPIIADYSRVYYHQISHGIFMCCFILVGGGGFGLYRPKSNNKFARQRAARRSRGFKVPKWRIRYKKVVMQRHFQPHAPQPCFPFNSLIKESGVIRYFFLNAR